jgi:hypothetical protein
VAFDDVAPLRVGAFRYRDHQERPARRVARLQGVDL